MAGMSRQDVVLAFEEILDMIRNAADVDDELLGEKIDQLSVGIPCPDVSGIIFYPHYYGLNPEGETVEKMADAAMSYKPFELGPG